MPNFEILATRGRARRGTIMTAHGPVETPAFLPCATHGTVKGIVPNELEELGLELILSNIYHLYLRPGIERIEKLGGIHRFMGWNPSTSSGRTRAIFTDSGGFQAFSLGKHPSHLSTSQVNRSNTFEVGRIGGKPLVRTTEEGMAFRSHIDGSSHFFTPEDVINYQIRIGVDIATCLDVCTGFPETEEKVGWAVDVTNRWAERSIEACSSFISQESFVRPRRTKDSCEMFPSRSQMLLYGMVQGSIYPQLRERSAKFLRELPFYGFAIGGNMYTFGAPLAELVKEKPKMWEILDLLDDLLPKDKPRHLLGVGEPADIIEGVRHGIDTFDCVMATRMARNGAIWRWAPLRNSKSETRNPKHSLTHVILNQEERWYERVSLASARFAADGRALAEDCRCPACASGLKRAWFHHAFRVGETLALRLATVHNLAFLQGIIKDLRTELRGE